MSGKHKKPRRWLGLTAEEWADLEARAMERGCTWVELVKLLIAEELYL